MPVVAARAGETVLCLSGGGAMGHYHFGVVRTLLDEGVCVALVCAGDRPRVLHSPVLC
jgi:predicted acylesterase/phospholipase RssA